MNPPITPPRPPSILVVDDDPINIKVFSDIFGDECDVLFAVNGENALAIAASSLPDIILLDVLMPGMDGYEVCRRIKADAVTRDIPVIFVTGTARPEETLKGLELGAVDFLRKPVFPEVVRTRVRTQLKLRQTQRELADCQASLHHARHSLAACVDAGAAVVESKAAATTSAAEPAPVRILIIDDELADIRLMTDLFESRHEVLFAMDGPKALELAATMQPDLILLDVMMPDMDGFTVCRRLKSGDLTRHIPVIFVTASLSPEREIEGLETGAIDYITKPINPAVVKARVNTHLRLARAMRQLDAFNLRLEHQIEELSNELHAATASLLELREELVGSEARATLTTLIASTSHELATPIGNSVLASGMLNESTDSLMNLLEGGKLRRSELEGFLGDLRDANGLLQRNLARARDLLHNFKQVASDQASEQRRKFDLAVTLQEVITTMAPSIKHKPHKVVLDAPEGILMDSQPGPIGQIVINLINNAYLHAFEKRSDGILTIHAEKQGDRVLLQFTDNGVGIPEENLKRIFDPFFSTKIGKGGTGLGMAIVESLVKKHLGGTLNVHSTVGVGTRFDFLIPLISPH